MTRKKHGRKGLGQITMNYGDKRRGKNIRKQRVGPIIQTRAPERAAINLCVTCGEPGASVRADGRMYHNRCWKEWNGEPK